MKSKQLHQPFEILISDMNDWNDRPLVSHFFEIVQIIEGKGCRIINKNNFTYSAGSIFLFTPMDCRGFQSVSPTKYCSIRFSEVFLSEYKYPEEQTRIINWLKQLEYIFSHHNRFQELIIRQPEDCKLIAMLIESTIVEYRQKKQNYQYNLQHFLTLILNILERNVSPDPIILSEKEKEPLINKILVHIRQHINCPKRLRIQFLSEKFNLSANYVGEYFKKLTGETLVNYIITYKVNLISQRLIYSEMTVGQIAHELGFTDESHLNRHFKKKHGLSPTEYRKITLGNTKLTE